MLQGQANLAKGVRANVEEERLAWEGEPEPAISKLCTIFCLSDFERSVLLLCAGVELDSQVADICSSAHGNPNSPYPTFGLALASFPNAHWSALLPGSPLRRFRLLEVLSSHPPCALATSPLRIDERVLHYLTGISYLEPQFNGLLMHITDKSEPLVYSHELLVQQVLLSWGNHRNRMSSIQLWGADESSKMAIAWEACSRSRLDLWELPGELTPTRIDEIDRFVQLWSREVMLLCSGLYISAEDIVEPIVQKTIRRLIQVLPSPVFLGTRDRWSFLDSRSISLEVRKPNRIEQGQLWKTFFGSVHDKPDDRNISKLVNQFDLNAHSIKAATEEASLLSEGGVDICAALWDACRGVCRPRLSELAQQIIPKAEHEGSRFARKREGATR